MNEDLEETRWLTGGSWYQACIEIQSTSLGPDNSLVSYSYEDIIGSCRWIDALVSSPLHPTKGLPKFLDPNDIPKSQTDPPFPSRLALCKRRPVSQ